MNNSKKKSVIVVGSYGRGNLGDDAFLVAISKLISNHKMVFNTSGESKIPNLNCEYELIPTPLFQKFFKKMKLFISADYVIYGGGDVWVDLHEDFFKRKSLWKMLIVNLTSKLFNKKIYYVSVGAGDISGLSLLIARLSALLANKIIYRDNTSILTIGVPGETLPDITCMLIKDIPTFSKNKVRKIGVSVLYYIDNPKANFTRYIDNLSKEIKKFNHKNIKLYLLPMLVSDKLYHDDYWASLQLKSKLKDYNVSIVLERDPTSVIELIKEYDVMIATRLHASIFAMWCGTLPIGIAYRPKVKRFYDSVLASNLCVDINSISSIRSILTSIQSRFDDSEILNIQSLSSDGKIKYEKIFQNI